MASDHNIRALILEVLNFQNKNKIATSILKSTVTTQLLSNMKGFVVLIIVLIAVWFVYFSVMSSATLIMLIQKSASVFPGTAFI